MLLNKNQGGGSNKEEKKEIEKSLGDKIKAGLKQVTSAVKQATTSSTPANSTAITATTTSGSSTSSISSVEESHSLGVRGVIKVTHVFYNNRAELAEQFAPVSNFFGKFTKKATKLNTEIKKELELLYPPADEKSPQGQKKIELFITHLFSLVTDFTHLLQPEGNIDVSFEANSLVKKIKSLLDEFESLNLEAMFNQYVPDSWKQLKEEMLKKVATSMKHWLFKIEAKAAKIEAEMKAAYIQAGHGVSLDQFQRLSHSVKDGILLSMESALTLYQKFILMLDKLEVQFGFREGALLHMLTQGYPEQTPEKEPATDLERKGEKKPTDYTKSIISKFTALSDHYVRLIKDRGFLPIELFPYSYSKQEARGKLKGNIITDFNRKSEEYKSITKNTRVAVTEALISKKLLKKVNLDWNEEKVTLPDEITTASEATTWKEELSAQLNYLKQVIKPLKEKISKDDASALLAYQDNKKTILAYHKQVIAILRDLEFFLLEKDRIEKIIAKLPPIDGQTSPRQLQPAETLKLLKAQCQKIMDTAKPYLNNESEERKRLTGFKVEIEKKKKQIEKLFNPIFVDYANQQFLAEKSAMEKAAIEKAEAEKIEEEKAVSGANIAVKDEGEKKQENPSINVTTAAPVLTQSLEESKSVVNLEEKKQEAPVTQNPVSVTINNPFTHFSHELLICIFRALDSINILIALASRTNANSKAKSPSEALAEDLAQANNIVAHAGEAVTAYLKFSSYLKQAALEEVPVASVPVVKVDEEKKDVVPAEVAVVVKAAEENNRVVKSAVTPDDIERKHDLLPEQGVIVDFAQAVPAPQVAKQSFMDQFKKKCSKKLDDKATALLSYLEIYKNNWFGLSVETQNLVIDITEGFKSVVPQFYASYSDYLTPPTKKTHAGVVATNIVTLYNLITNVDKLIDIISSNRFTISLKILWYINQCIKELFVLIDQVEIYFYLKQGIILEKLKKISIKDRIFDIERLMEILQIKLAGSHHEFLPDDYYPYSKDILAKRDESSKDGSNLVKEVIANHPVAPSLSVDPQFPLARRQLTELKCQTQSGLSTELTRIKQSALEEFFDKQNDHKHSETYVEDLDDIALKNEDAHLLFESQLSEDLKAKNNRNKILVELDSGIDKLKAKRSGWFLSHRNLEKRIIFLEEFRSILRRDGYTLADASKVLTTPKWKILRSTDKALTDRLDRIEKQSPEDKTANKKIIVARSESKHPIDAANPIFARIESRIRELKKKRYKPSNNISKQKLLNALLDNLRENKISFKNALQMVKQKFPDEAYLLYNKDTGKMIRDIEQQTSTSRVIKSTVQSLRLKYFSSEAKLSSKKSEIKEAAEGVRLLQQIKASPHVPLNPDQEKRLNRIAPALLPSRQNRP